MKKRNTLYGLAFVFAIFAIGATPAAGASFPDRPADLWISTALSSIMERDGRVESGNVEASCREGVIALRGAVSTEEERAVAEQLAMMIPGVRGIVNDLSVTPSANRNGRMAQEIRSALLENPSLHIKELNVRARDGVVTLKGIVNDKRERRLADRLVMMTPNVHRVVDQIAILPAA